MLGLRSRFCLCTGTGNGRSLRSCDARCLCTVRPNRVAPGSRTRLLTGPEEQRPCHVGGMGKTRRVSRSFRRGPENPVPAATRAAFLLDGSLSEVIVPTIAGGDTLHFPVVLPVDRIVSAGEEDIRAVYASASVLSSRKRCHPLEGACHIRRCRA